jgi:hypothetical protein
MADILMGLHRSTFSKPNSEFNSEHFSGGIMKCDSHSNKCVKVQDDYFAKYCYFHVTEISCFGMIHKFNLCIGLPSCVQYICICVCCYHLGT